MNQLIRYCRAIMKRSMEQKIRMMDEGTSDTILLAFDPNPDIRCELAYRGMYLHILVKDESAVVRSEVAKRGYGLKKLIHDPSPMVRRTVVATTGYGYEIASLDQDATVRFEAEKYITKEFLEMFS